MEKKVTYSIQNQNDHVRYLDALKEEFINKCNTRDISNQNPEDYDIIKTIGSGAYGEVYLVRDKRTFSYHAMKVVEKAIVVERKHVKHLLLEKKIAMAVNFPYIGSMDVTFKDNLYLYFVEPFFSGGELFSYIQKCGGLSDDVVKFYCCQLILALEYLHHCNIIHRDLKPENVLLDITGYIKLCDFGFSKIISKKTWTLCGTPEYLAPEMIMSKGYTYSVDWWALGVMIFEMRAGHPPFFSSEPSKLYENILSGHYKCPDNMDKDCKNLIKGLLQVDPTKRLGSFKRGAFDIKIHCWFFDVDWSNVVGRRQEVPYIPVCSAPGDTSNFPELTDVRIKKSPECHFKDEFEDF